MGHSNPSVNQSTIGAIETLYAGCRFRSRLEARWAVFFDTLGIDWQYEPQGFVGCHGKAYLPDFYLPADKLYVEVKGSDEQLRADSAKIGEAIDYRATDVARGLLILGPIPRFTYDDTIAAHPLLTHYKGVDADLVTWQTPKAPNGWAIDRSNRHLPRDSMMLGNTSEEIPANVSVEARLFNIFVDGKPYGMSSCVAEAYEAARTARFEHGETPKR